MKKEVLEPQFRPVINFLIVISLSAMLIGLFMATLFWSMGPREQLKTYSVPVSRSAGSNNLQYARLILSASGGQVNHAIRTDACDVLINGDLIVTGTIINGKVP